MKRYLMAFFISWIPIFVLVGIAEMLIRELPTPYSEKYELIKDSDYSTLILGSSHTYSGLNPEYFSTHTINAANSSQDFKYDLHILKTSLAFRKNIRYVILPVSMFSLTSELNEGKESWRRFNYSHFMGFHQNEGVGIFDLREYSVFLANPNRLGLLKKSFLALAGTKTERDWSSNGWGSAYHSTPTMDNLISTGKSAAARHQRNATLNQVSINSLGNIAKLCQLNGIRLILVTPPAYISYRQNIEASRLAEIISEVEKLQSTYANISYSNYFDDPRFTASDFFDADHLNHQGAEKLSRLINNEIN